MRIISTLAKYITRDVLAPGVSKMRFYRVFIELTQNVALYSDERHLLPDVTSIGSGYIFIQSNKTFFKCTTINRIRAEHQQILIDNCSKINDSSEDELKIRKERLRKESLFRETGAHIGLITVCLRSCNPLDSEIIHDNETGSKYFSITTTINKT